MCSMGFADLFKFKVRKSGVRIPEPELIEICTYTVGDLESSRKDLVLVNTDYEVEEIKRILGNFPELDEYKAFLVRVDDGEIKEIYGIPSEIPYSNEPACRLRVKLGKKIILG